MTNIEKIRLIIGDKSAPYQFTNIELQSFLDDEGSVKLAAATALESWAASYVTSPDSEHIGDYSYSQSITKKMLDMAAQLRESDAMTPAITWAEPDLMGESK